MKTLITTATFSTQQMVDAFISKGYELKKEPHYPNLFGIRSEDNTPNKFNDLIGSLTWNGLAWNVYFAEGTTETGLYWMLQPLNVNGTIILIPGQYKNCYKVGSHKGYRAYEQVGKMDYVRDNNKDKILDLLYKLVGFKKLRENAKTNIHHANEKHTSTIVDKWSAGCQVVASPLKFGNLLAKGINWVEALKKENLFNYTLFEENDIK